jgi:hypothetical protein
MSQQIDDIPSNDSLLKRHLSYEEQIKIFLKGFNSNQCSDITEGQYCVLLDASKSIDSLNPHVKYFWYFLEDSTQKEGLIVKKCFDDGGSHLVKLTVYDTLADYDPKQDSLIELYFYPKWNFDYTMPVKQYRQVDFFVKSYNNYYPSNIIYWDFDDGISKIGTKATHHFEEPGKKNVKMMVFRDENGHLFFEKCISKTIKIEPLREDEY